ncbi:hypothetical protein [Puerhibacterium sp. TATVAM-FAB25]|uniref:hypothetical protein n=1 Tax=Puerhibacterium sp. TATVAM-FAB25 TaxID=3093699 RepID=UPI00397E011B
MRHHLRDWIALGIAAAIVVPYVGYLVRGSMPFVQDPRGMAAVALVLGVAGFMVLDVGTDTRRPQPVELLLAGGTVALGLAAFLLAETVLAEGLLAALVVAVVLVLLLGVVHDRQFVTTHRGGAPQAHV